MADSADNSLFRFAHLRPAKAKFRSSGAGESPSAPAPTISSPAPGTPGATIHLPRSTSVPSSAVVSPRLAELRESRDLFSTKRDLERFVACRDLNLSSPRDR